MATPIFGSPIQVIEGETVALSDTADYLPVKPGFHEVKMYCASQWRLALSPTLLYCLKYDTGTTTYTDYTTQATDKLSTTDVVLNAMGADDYLYLGTTEQVLGFYFDMDATNVQDNAVATLDVEYCSTAVGEGTSPDARTAIVFTDVGGTDADGTDADNKTLAQDGVYTWGTAPGTAWVRSALGTYDVPLYSKCYWIRFKPAGAFSAAVQVNQIIPVYKNTDYAYMEPGIEYQFSLNVAKVGGFVYKATAGTPALDISWVRH